MITAQCIKFVLQNGSKRTTSCGILLNISSHHRGESIQWCRKRRSFSTNFRKLPLLASRLTLEARSGQPFRYLSVTNDTSSSSKDTAENDKSSKMSAEQITTAKDTFVKVIAKPKVRTKIDYSKSYTDNIFITPTRAMQEYLLAYSDLDKLQKYKRRSPYPNSLEHIYVLQRKDVITRATEVWGSAEKLEWALKSKQQRELDENLGIFRVKSTLKEYRKQHSNSTVEVPYYFVEKEMQKRNSIFKSGSGRVVLFAIGVNAANFVAKTIAWLYTGSHCVFAEMVHSLADTLNQVILAFGIHRSYKLADKLHPYGWGNFRYISSLISGVGIFFLGGGISCYHGFLGVLHPQPLDSLYWAILILAGSFVSECATLLVAYLELKSGAKKAGLTFLQYVRRGIDPSTNVVLLEDLAAVTGVSIAGTCMTVSHYTGHPLYDAGGSFIIGMLLGSVASFIIHTNVSALVGQALHDIKATEMGGRMVKFKAEVDFDGKEVTRSYLDKQNLDALLEEAKAIKTVDDLEEFMLKHGEATVNLLGAEIDRIEKNLKKKFPEIRHVDLEAL